MSTLPPKYTFKCWEGSTFRKLITVLSAGPGSTPTDLTGYTGIMTIRTAPGATPFYTMTTGTSQIVLGTTSGTISLYISAADTLTLEGTGGIYELDVIASGGAGDTVPILWGPFRVLGVA